MKNLKTTSLAIISLVLLFASCSIEKRVHMSGYHVEWNKSDKFSGKNDKVNVTESSKSQVSLNKIEISSNSMAAEDELFVSNSNEILMPSTKLDILKIEKQKHSIKKVSNNDCDIIILKNGEEIQAKVLEVSQTEVKYKNCDNQNGPTFSKSKSEIFMIKYPNGTNTVIEESKSNNSSIVVNVNNNSNDNTTNKSLVIAVVLWFFLGIIGIHRFYLGHVGIGVLYLLTGGLCGIGWLIDGVMFLTGGLKPKNGNYSS